MGSEWRFITRYWLFAGLLLFGAEPLSAKPLTEQDLRGVTSVAIYPGTFDPINRGHLGLSEAAIREGKVQKVIFLPNVTPVHKEPLPLEDRLKMIDLAAGG